MFLKQYVDTKDVQTYKIQLGLILVCTSRFGWFVLNMYVQIIKEKAVWQLDHDYDTDYLLITKIM